MKYHRGIVNLELSSPNEYENITEQKYNFDTFEISSIKTKSNHQNKEIDLSIDNSSTYEGCQRLPNPTFDISATKVIATEEPQKQIKQNLKYYTNDPIDINQSKQIDLSIDNSSTYEGYQRLPNPNLSFASNEIIASEEPQKQIREFNEIENPFVVEESLQFEYDTIDEPNNYKSLEVSPIESNETQNEQIHLSIDNSSTYEGCQRLPHPNLSISANEIIAEQPQSKQIKLSIDSASMHEWCLQLPNPTFGISSNSIIISEAPQNKESDLSIGSASIEQLNNSNLSVSTNEIISKASQTVHKPLKLSPFAANETQCKEIDLSIDSASIYEGCQRLSNADLDVTSNTIIISQEPQIKIENVTTQNDNKTLEISPIEVNETKDKEVDLEIDYSSTYEGCERIVDVSEKQIIISEDPTNNAKIRSLEISPIEVNETKDKEVDLAIDYSSIYEGCERIVDVSEKQIIISEDPTNNSKIRSLEISPIEVNEAKDNEIDLAIDYSSTYEGCERIVAPKFDVTTKEIITTKEKNNFKLEISRIESNEIKDKHTNDLMITEVSNYEECERIIAPKFDFTTKEIVNYENHNILELSPVESNYIENEYLADLVIEDSSNYEGCDRFIIPKFDFMTNETFSEEPKTEFHKPFKLTVDASTQHETKNEENLTLLTYTIFDQIGNETNLEISSVNEVTENHFPTLTITRQSPYYIYSFGMPGSCNYSPQLLPSKAIL
ncbi:hypothetical protein GPJ56_009749 [Histomonas meleagridis]|uniref:uncharacterized protein n=1 Tax=Histomonas meleagridis TaxID=135588 RepID=UPI00355A07A3|nr:hypothetical protein GPJ56_009749 [Histomonas meleagridis]KAH0802311.1 hypothetical protein GO595_004924 [Histomonas meleagridis]